VNSPELDALLARRNHLIEWLQRNKTAQDLLPAVQHELELTELNIRALSNPPEEASEIPREDLSFTLNHENQHLMMSLPLPPAYLPLRFESDSDAIVSGSTATITTTIARIAEIGTVSAKEYAASYFSDYQRIQDSQSRHIKVRSLLQPFNREELLQAFDSAYKAYIAAKSGTMNDSAAASEIRTFLYKLKGELFEVARRMPRENMTWSRMSHRLAKGNSEEGILAARHKFELILEDQLSNLLKLREGERNDTLGNIWPRVLDHVYIILNSVSLP
jgi:hypothetical protein